MQTRPLKLREAQSYRTLMLKAYAEDPDAYTSTAADREELPLAWWEDRIGRDDSVASLVVGAFDADLLAGVCGLSFQHQQKTRHLARVFGMYVLPDLRRKGVGGNIIRAVIDVATERPETLVLQVTVNESNASAVRLYERHGFVPYGIEPYAYRTADGFARKVHLYRPLKEV